MKCKRTQWSLIMLFARYGSKNELAGDVRSELRKIEPKWECGVKHYYIIRECIHANSLSPREFYIQREQIKHAQLLRLQPSLV
jgi:hypothetical protein